MTKQTAMPRTVFADRLFAEAREINMVAIGVDIQVVDSGTEMVHELAQRTRRDGPVMRCILLAKFGVHRHSRLERQAVGRSEARPKNDAGNEPALDVLAVFNGNVTAVNQCLSFRIAVTLRVGCGTAAKERDESLWSLQVSFIFLVRRIVNRVPNPRTRMYMLQWNRSLNWPVA